MPVCETCNDTHAMNLNGAVVMCTRCPVPCQTCRSDGTGPYCETTPCACSCHKDPLKLARPIVIPVTEPDERSRMFEIAMLILGSVRLYSADEESRWHEEVAGKCHVWGDFYGPATSAHLARAIAHRFMDRQGGDLAHLEDAWRRYGAGAGGER